jgi:hypothetical protein
MGRSERHAFFEQIVAMRAGYLASPDDRRAVLSIADAIRYGEAIMIAVELDAEPWLPEPDQVNDDVAGAGPDHPGHPRRFASDLWPRPIRSSRSLRLRDEADRG